MAVTPQPPASSLEEMRKQADVELEPALRPLAEQALAVFELAAKKAIAHDQAPKQYPLPKGGGHPEQILAARLRQRPADKRKRAAQQVMPTISGGRVPAVLPGLATRPAIDLRTPVPISDQIAGVAPKLGLKPEALADARPVAAAAAAATVLPYTRVELRLRKVVCVDETRELGSDEFDLAGVTIDASGDTGKLARFRVSSDFDSGEKVVYTPPKTLAVYRFSADKTITIDGVTKNVGWPRYNHFTFLPAEIDNGGFPDFAAQLYEKAKVIVTAYVAKAVGSALGGAVGAVIGAIVGKVTAWVMDKLFGLLVRWWEDDMFIPLTSKVKVHSPTADLNGKVGGPAVTSQRMFWWKQHGGHYEIHFEWALRRVV